jgi:hypothetical protein
VRRRVLDIDGRRYDQPNAFGDHLLRCRGRAANVDGRERGLVDAQVVGSGPARWRRCGDLIASIAMAVIAGTIALELHRNMFGWMVTAFVVTFVVVSAAVYALG